MTRKVLNCFGIDRGIYQVRNVCVPELMGGYMEVQTIDYIPVVGGFLPKYRGHGVNFLFPIFISHIRAFLDGACFNVFPDSLELGIRQRIAVPVGNNIVGFRCCFWAAMFWLYRTISSQSSG